MIKLPYEVDYIINKLRSFGHRADIVGGCVRDFLRGQNASDYDITTDATPDEMRCVFSEDKTVETGIKHGTLTVIVNKKPYEVTTWRVDGEYTDNRHPDSVVFTNSLVEDLSRRDFTMNAIAYNDRDGFSDVFGGIADIKNRIIRAVGEPSLRFSEDALRILRALRFSATLNFQIEENTSRAIHTEASRLSNVSGERINAEWRKLISGGGAHRVISEYPDVIARILGIEDEIKLPCEDRFLTADWQIRELSIFVLAARDRACECFCEAMSKLKSDNKHRDFGKLVLENLSSPTGTRDGVHRLLISAYPEGARGVLELREAMGEDVEHDKTILNGLVDSGAPYRISDLKIDGNDLKELGYQGKEIGEILKSLLFEVAAQREENTKEGLIGKVTKRK